MKQLIVEDSSMKMVDLNVVIPGIQFDLKYSTKDNFLKEPFYPTNLRTTYLRFPAALALKKVQAELKAIGYSLKIWDAYRPYSATEKMWEAVKDDRYAADPKYGSGHNRGIAVDLTLIDLKSGKELDMGTGFDNFSDTAHSDYNKLSAEILNHRKVLRAAMERNGFKVLDTEWWHFYLPDSKKYALMDLPFKAIGNIVKKQKIKL